jgi:hypothetical protein
MLILGRRTGLANEQEEPHAAGEIEKQGHGISRIPEQIEYREESAV